MNGLNGYIPPVRFEKVWVEQCRATKTIKRRFGAKRALDYLIGEKLITFADTARDHPAFAAELPRFLAAIWLVFNEYEIAGYVVTRRRTARKRLQSSISSSSASWFGETHAVRIRELGTGAEIAQASDGSGRDHAGARPVPEGT
jgi:hypothetical protein